MPVTIHELYVSCFNVTAPVKARKSACSAMESISAPSLQCDRACEGAEIQVQDSVGKPGLRLQCDRACEGAEINNDNLSQRWVYGFNVTAPVKARKCWTVRVASRSKACFNVTAPVKARKSSAQPLISSPLTSLQCDRACEGAEMRRMRYLPAPDSMLQCDRACEGAEMGCCAIDPLHVSVLQCDRACEGAEMRPQLARAAAKDCFNVTAPVKARK